MPLSTLTLPHLPVLVPQVALDPRLRKQAATLALTRAHDLCASLEGQFEQRQHARVSDAGRCALELYTFLRGEHNLPDDGVNQIAKLDNGTMFGWWLAALQATAIAEWWGATTPDCGPPEFAFEEDVAYAGVVPGHIDLGVRIDGKPWWLIENKSTYSTLPIEPPHLHAPQQPLQAAAYASEGGYERFSIVTIGPAVQNRWNKDLKCRIDFPKLAQFDYDTAEWADRAKAEMARLVDIANADVPPEPDLDAVWRVRTREGKIVEGWRCRFCRYGACPKNDNPLRHLIET